MRTLALAVCVLFAACSDDDPAAPPGSPDAAPSDVAPADGGPADADAETGDAEVADVGPGDAEPADADASASDAEVTDASASDAEVTDASASDAEVTDASASDAEVTDATPPDVGAGDVGPGDGGPSDGGPGDGSVADGGPSDAGAADSGVADAGAPAGCPPSRPADGASCGMVNLGCTYANVCCVCDANGVGSCGAGTFTCIDLTNDSRCPAQPPADGSACSTSGLICRYCTSDARPFRACDGTAWVAAPLACP